MAVTLASPISSVPIPTFGKSPAHLGRFPRDGSAQMFQGRRGSVDEVMTPGEATFTWIENCLSVRGEAGQTATELLRLLA